MSGSCDHDQRHSRIKTRWMSEYWNQPRRKVIHSRGQTHVPDIGTKALSTFQFSFLLGLSPQILESEWGTGKRASVARVILLIQVCGDTARELTQQVTAREIVSPLVALRRSPSPSCKHHIFMNSFDRDRNVKRDLSSWNSRVENLYAHSEGCGYITTVTFKSSSAIEKGL